MGARGRKSGTELATVAPVGVVHRPEPPLELTPEQSDAWCRIVDAMPADWFSAENHPLLKQYVRAEVEARRISQLIDQECARDDLDVSAYIELLKAQNQQSTVLKTLAASMRLAQQARYGARSSDTARGKGRTVRRPWESD